MWSAIASIILGVTGWIIARLLFEPVNEIVGLRRDAQEALIIHGNLTKDAPPEDRRAAADAFRRIGAGLASRYIAAYPWVRWFCVNCLRWDVYSAATMLVGLGDSTQFEGYSIANVSPIVPLIRTCLRLRTPEQPPTIRALMEHAARPAPIGPGDL
jgi:hypothetical protein